MATARVQKILWKRRPAFRLSNGVVDLVALTGGGHIASFAFAAGSGFPQVNALWEAPWPTIDPEKYRARHARQYGPEPAGSFLSGFTGHTLCLDYFGAPSDEELKAGLRLHGEAAGRRWKRTRTHAGTLALETQLPAAGLLFRREVQLRRGESVIYFLETVKNERAEDRFCHWVQHATFGAPLLAHGESIVALSASRARTWPHGYEGKAMLADSRDFEWPNAPAADGGTCDLSQPFTQTGKGFVAAVLTDSSRHIALLAILNWRLGLAAGYCFRRNDFPWIAVWEENCARTGPPWNGRTQARGLEFGTTPMPLGKAATFATGPLFETPTFLRVPARSEISARYIAFVTTVPKVWRSIEDVRVKPDAIVVAGAGGESVRVRAAGATKFLA